jgi:hypothetical protein
VKTCGSDRGVHAAAHCNENSLTSAHVDAGHYHF